MSSISPHPDGVSGPPGNNDGGSDNPDAAAPQGGYGNGPSAAPAGYPPGAMSSGSAAFASPPPGATPPPGHQSRPNQGGPTPPPAGPQGYGPPAYNAPSAPPPAAYGTPPRPNQQPYGNPPQGRPPGAPQPPYGSPPPPHGPGGQAPQGPPPHPAGPPNAYGQPGQYGQPTPPPPGPPQHPQGPPVPVGAPNPQGQVPQAPYATRIEPGRDMPMAGASPIRRNLDDTAELPAFLDSARSDEGPGTETRKAEVKPQVRKFPLTTGFTALLRHRYAMSVLVRRDLAVKYQSTVMGYVWSLIEPLGLTLIYWFVFDLVFGGGRAVPGGAGYLLFIVSGIFAYQWFSSAVSEGAKSLGGQASLITVMKVPREVFPVSKVFARFAEYVVGFPILIIVAIFFGGHFGLNMLWLIPAILVEAMLLAGMVFILAAANVLYKDVQRFLPLVMRVLFYASAIIYPVTKVSEAKTMQDNPWMYDVFSINPLIGIFSMHRAAFIPGLAPNTFQLCVAVGFSVFLMFFGRWIFYRLEPRVLKAL
ncbi:ABC transporter permease [Glycomyces sp. A-F 0318]|uniref:ABC transporter permease n=1 Tax=Glycomyces amatae TaxID=2881355 RepID=UPI001E29F598|nr:ABC transporter permease [Glycomyces amatae]MCD0444357.1 ABC transporter permease [Glycomyces amatae]